MTLPQRENNKSDEERPRYQVIYVLKTQRRRDRRDRRGKMPSQSLCALCVLSVSALSKKPRGRSQLSRKIEAAELRIQPLPLINFPNEAIGHIEHGSLVIVLPH